MADENSAQCIYIYFVMAHDLLWSWRDVIIEHSELEVEFLLCITNDVIAINAAFTASFSESFDFDTVLKFCDYEAGNQIVSLPWPHLTKQKPKRCFARLQAWSSAGHYGYIW